MKDQSSENTTWSVGLSVFRLAAACRKFIAGLADVLVVDNCACENARDIQAIGEGGIGTVRNRHIAFEVDAGRKDSQSFPFDNAGDASSKHEN
jgi:hypothetical protein